MNEDSITRIFRDVDDFRRALEAYCKEHLLPVNTAQSKWFPGFKPRLIINGRGEILSFALTAGNVDDRNTEVIDLLCRELTGKLFGDRGYIPHALFEKRYRQGIRLITRLKKNMKNILMDRGDKLLLRKRAVIESVNDFLKNICQVEHTRQSLSEEVCK